MTLKEVIFYCFYNFDKYLFNFKYFDLIMNELDLGEVVSSHSNLFISLHSMIR